MNVKEEHLVEKYLAHISEDGQREQTVEEHLLGTAALCEKFAAAFGAAKQGRWIGLAHDVGKYSPEFQERLRGGHIVDHATAGAWECRQAGSKERVNTYWAAFCVAGHHSGLPDMGNPKTAQAGDGTLRGRLKKAESGQIPRYTMPSPLEPPVPLNGYGKDPLTDSFLTRMLYSCLVDADFLDTEAFMSGGTAERGGGDPLPVLLERLYSNKISAWLKEDGRKSVSF